MAKSSEKKTIAEAKEPKAEKAKKTNASSASSFLKEIGIGIDLNDEQLKQVDANLRVRTSRATKAYVRVVQEVPKDLGPQQRVLVESLSDKEPMTTGQWVEACGEDLNTRQDPMRVVNFYKRELENKGLIKAV